MQLPFSFRLLSALLAGGIVLSGCYSREDMKGETATSTPTATTEAPASGTPAAAAANQPLALVNVFLEVSGSMEGFMPKTGADAQNTQFQQHVAQFLSDLNRSSAARQKAFYRIKEKPCRDSYQQLSQTVRGGIREAASSTSIPAILDTLVSHYYQPGAVSVLISDFIYAPPRTGDQAYVQTDITDALNRTQRPGLAVSVYGFTSDFRGTFYPALKTGAKRITSCCDTPIPYYFWVLGPAEAVRQFDAALLTRQPGQQAHFGVHYPTPASSLLNKFQNKGAWYYGDAGASKRAAGATYHTVAVQSASTQEPAEFVVGLKLNDFPAAYRNLAYLKQNLQLIGQDMDAQVVDAFAANAQTQHSSGPENQYSHFVKVRLTQQPRAARSFQLILNRRRPAWVGQWTTRNDSNINQVGAKTFALSSLLDGVAAVTTDEQDEAPVFVIQLTLRPGE